MNDVLLFGVAVSRLVDIVIVLTLVEGTALVLFHRITGRGPPPHELVFNLASGVCLMLALRVALDGTGSWAIALCLAASGLAHGLDLWRRWDK